MSRELWRRRSSGSFDHPQAHPARGRSAGGDEGASVWWVARWRALRLVQIAGAAHTRVFSALDSLDRVAAASTGFHQNAGNEAGAAVGYVAGIRKRRGPVASSDTDEKADRPNAT